MLAIVFLSWPHQMNPRRSVIKNITSNPLIKVIFLDDSKATSRGATPESVLRFSSIYIPEIMGMGIFLRKLNSKQLNSQSSKIKTADCRDTNTFRKGQEESKATA
jgi:hypothetical protein